MRLGLWKRRKREEVLAGFCVLSLRKPALESARGQGDRRCVQPSDRSGRAGRPSNKILLGRGFLKGWRVAVSEERKRREEGEEGESLGKRRWVENHGQGKRERGKRRKREDVSYVENRC